MQSTAGNMRRHRASATAPGSPGDDMSRGGMRYGTRGCPLWKGKLSRQDPVSQKWINLDPVYMYENIFVNALVWARDFNN